MANLKSGATIAGNLIFHSGNLPLNAHEDHVYVHDEKTGNNYEIYHEGHKPTNVELNMVSRAGDTMTGELKANGNISIQNANPKIGFIESDSSNKRWEIEMIGGNFQIDEAGVSPRLTLLAGGEVRFTGVVKQQHEQGTTSDSLTRKDYVDAADDRKVNKAGDTMSGSLNISSAGFAPKLVLDRTDSTGNISIGFKNSEDRIIHFGLKSDGHLAYGTDTDLSNKGATIYSTSNKPKWEDVEGLDYFSKDSSGYILATKWLRCSSGAGIIPFENGQGVVGSSSIKFGAGYINTMNSVTVNAPNLNLGTEAIIKRNGDDIEFYV